MIWKRAHMKKLIILRGNSGSGKTSVSKELQKRFGRNTMLISQDMVRREILCVKDGIGTKALPLLISFLFLHERSAADDFVKRFIHESFRGNFGGTYKEQYAAYLPYRMR